MKANKCRLTSRQLRLSKAGSDADFVVPVIPSSSPMASLIRAVVIRSTTRVISIHGHVNLNVGAKYVVSSVQILGVVFCMYIGCRCGIT